MNKQAHSRKFTAKQSARLGAYLAAGVGASMLATANSDAAIIGVDISAFAGPNGGLPPNSSATINDWAGPGTGTLYPYSGATYALNGNRWWGLYEGPGLQFAVSGIRSSPTNFSSGSPIGSSAVFSLFGYQATFQNFYSFSNQTYTSPDFGPNSFMGFRFVNGSGYNYGWLEVTWDAATTTLEVLSGAYETDPDVAILAGQGPGPAPIPEPGTWAAAALLVGGAPFDRWRKRRDDAQKEAA